MSRDQLTRREMLGVVGAAIVGRPVETLSLLERQAQMPACVVRPEQTEGPYFVDERLNRADLRLDPTDGSIKDGALLRVRMAVARVDGSACAPLPGATVDLWQCDALGVYSDVRDFQGLFDTRGKKFLRGHQVTDRNGAADFLTIYPGWYAGRTPHIHFKIRVPAGPGGRAYEFTSQLYFDEAITDQVYTLAPYNTKGPRDTRNAQDRIFAARDSGPQLVLPVTKESGGATYAGTFAIGLRMGG
jgi:protocatechuate 3,4-dioxygenase beta subunit